MKEKSPGANKLITRNWVSKRKRKRTQSAKGASSRKDDISAAHESEENASPTKQQLKSEVSAGEPSCKKKGNDGYYFECVICDIGGNLLCCESCPRTYHIQCLDPPLKRIPTGKWNCPECCKKADSYEPMSHLDTVARRARTKVVTKRRSCSKGKSVLNSDVKLEMKLDSSQLDDSCSIKPNQSSDVSMDGSASFVHADGTNINTVSLTDSSVNKVSCFPTTEMASNMSLAELEPDDEVSEQKHESGSKLIDSCDDDADKTRKRKIVFDYKDRRKKHKKNKGQIEASSTKKHSSIANAVTSGGRKLHKKRKSHDRGESLSREDSLKKSSSALRKNKKRLRLVKNLKNKSKKVTVAHVVEIPTCEDSNTGEFLQVHHVLGCRLQGDSTNSSCAISTTVKDLQPVNEMLKSDNHKSLSENVDVGVVETLTLNSQNSSNGLEGREMKKINIKLNETHVYKTSGPKDSKGENMVNSSRHATRGSGSAGQIEEDHESAGAVGEGSEEDELVADRKNDVDLSYKVNVSKNSCEPHESCLDQEAKCADIETGISSSSVNKVQEPPCSEVEHDDKDKIQYEFLVKWVGKSNIHNSWISESQLRVLAKRKLENYKARFGTATLDICEERWKQPQRVLAVHTMKNGTKKVLIKWTGLPYDECTWEDFDEPVVRNSSHLIDLYYRFERQTLEKDAAANTRRKSDRRQGEIETLAEQPKELKGGSLFPHQLEALNWLRKCWYRSKNVILADEMGLGKTVSACAFISSLYIEFKAVLPCLVLVPLSTMPNWLAEFASWAPDLNVVEYHGCAKARAIIRQYEWHATDPNDMHRNLSSYKFNVVLTTYEMILADSSQLRRVPWEVLVVDEGHRLKNSESKLFSMLNTFSFQHRVLLTGTPLQNNIGEMYNLLNFLQPASFPSLSSFEEKFKDLATAEKVDELKKLVAPHMLRRLKKDAMKNIPPKTERLVPVELSSIQAEYYRAMLTKNYQILRNIGNGVAQQSMLNIVMQLRKVCNHPYLIHGAEPESGSVEFLHEMRIKASAKLTLLHSMLKLLHREGHRVLIFSQMTKLLDILEDYLSIEFGPKTYERVDGSVSVADRQAAIARFNQDKSRFVFLLSTRACGLGINLATADTVIIYDSDFNPHADIQAMNRAHRIGQSNRLLVYRLVVRASVEERILQLAKKKLMLDQLFVNKSGSQKEVEDILRWGTEELFSDAPSTSGKDTGNSNSNNDEPTVESEHKHRKRSGGLGDVYQDKCREGGSKIVWDENAILKLLDRSNLQSCYGDNAEGELENDMLGSVKYLEGNVEPTEQGGAESPSVATDGPCTENSGRKDENAVTSGEENEWDRLLRTRWERYQGEEEASLGRGKRQRKNVSYREAYASNLNDRCSEGGGEDEREPETVPEKEYTPAGRALKEKYAKLRARQKERIARRNSVVEWHHFEREHMTELPQQHLTENRGNEAGGLVHPPKEKSLANELASKQSVQAEDSPRSKKESASRKVRLTKQQKLNSHIDSVGQASSENFHSSNNTPTNLLPVLALYAPNAIQPPSPRRKSKQSVERQSRLGTKMQFPFSLPQSGSSTGTDLKDLETASILKPPEASAKLQQQQTYPPGVPQGKGFGISENANKMSLPKFPGSSMFAPRYDFLPTIPFGSRQEALSGSTKEMATTPLLQNLKFPSLETGDMQNQHKWEVHTTLGSGQMPSPFSSMPENHVKVLENILMRTGSGSSNLFKGKHKVGEWSEDELDSLWIGVRRYGRGNWVSMLRDPRLRFSKHKTPEDLAAKWKEEELKILEVPKSLRSVKSTKSPAFPGISNGMMERALHGSRLAAPPKFQSHLTDIKLGFTNMPPSIPHFETGQVGLQNDLFKPIPSWNIEKYCANFTGKFSGRPSEREGSQSNVLIERPIVPSSVGPLDLGHLGTSCSGSIDAQKKNDDLNRYRQLPGVRGRPLNIGPPFQKKLNDDTENLVLSGNNTGKDPFRSKEAVAGGTSLNDKLPHWLREAVSTSAKFSDPEMPSNVSAVAQSVRLLYGEEKPKIPPFEIPGPPPPQPEDPRQCLKKKRKNGPYSSSTVPPDITGSSQSFQSGPHSDNGVSSSSPMAPLFPLRPESMQGTSGSPWVESSLNLPPFRSSSASARLNLPKASSHGLSPSPEVLQLVATCIAPGPHIASVSGLSNSSFQESRLPTQVSGDRAGFQDQLSISEQVKESGESSALQEQGCKEIQDKVNSEDFSKTKSNPSPNQPDVEEASTEKTMLDRPGSDREP